MSNKQKNRCYICLLTFYQHDIKTKLFCSILFQHTLLKERSFYRVLVRTGQSRWYGNCIVSIKNSSNTNITMALVYYHLNNYKIYHWRTVRLHTMPHI